MNRNLSRLVAVAQKPERRIIGLMSGTSLDGLDVALCRFSGHGPATRVVVEHFATVPYSANLQAQVRRVFARQTVELQHLTLLHAWLGTTHADMVQQCLTQWQVAPTDVDAIASHGQTVFHAPRHQHGLPDWPNATLQLGDADHLAVRTGILTLSDFRQKHVAAGGQGAPLAVYGDYLIFSQSGEDRLLLNLGGIANFTYLAGNLDATAVFSTDTGPGNTLLDAFVRELYPGRQYDENGALAAQGQINTELLAALLDHPFFAASIPRTTGPELFSPTYVREAQHRSHTAHLAPPDLLATLTAFSATSIAGAVRQAFPALPALSIYASGGGMHNPTLMAALRAALPHCRFSTTAALGIAPDAKEAVLFAILANETLVGEARPIGRNEQAVPAVSLGKISFPD
ncbi:anhydro-N-acetylmuramic acid kinase [Hymenobacter chitinivorans]|uniref:Anhydro-N-acetylmuramic acid kinase n=1 Tax=Hymenobacter chitinivorans DSM 11115 TaxID=1121954 RepID=A0A2M9B9S0_9BACT|nr:anhydro-N-acetylmuramic acid kinase [Hymenobacter chitinivorans]PJJ54694.1 anhydro-N-acetylmuramic acid kinase [Hymenobacter chitinivorans DSM 11115]